MKFSTEDIGRLLASGRGYSQYALGVATTLGLVSASNSKGLTDSLNEIANGVSMIYHGATSFWQIAAVILTPIGSVILAKWSSNSAKTVNQSAAVNASVKEAVVAGKSIPLELKASAIDTAANIPEVKDSNPTIKVSDPILANAVPAINVVAK